MGYSRKKTDTNQADIVAALRDIPGVSVETGHDDILVGYRQKTYWMEIKNPAELTKDGRLRKQNNRTQKKQTKLRDEWTGHYSIVTSLDEILLTIGVIK